MKLLKGGPQGLRLSGLYGNVYAQTQKIRLDHQGCETKAQIVNQQLVVCHFQCNLCDTGSYVGYTRGHLHARVVGYNSTSSSVCKCYDMLYINSNN